jgi:hypothetical protein
MLNVRCIRCDKELNEPGALLITSPCEDMRCAKYHICVKCEKKIAKFIGITIFNKIIKKNK